ncbi:hypothetical protein [Engelhardtia mirabilis]|uniref:Uncharacterized protein n=1 Tax=Engelhardtia mirabilis TaxID=2528011 RepID=A0A518BDB7_9BACT|nr:hypothetical protein Pla133_00430 [Planctomycetes bacterium Pla133]QDU99307.1 hypothetical protein Pla86_00430 [Planctomycetes bacterium Pla86]
MNERHDREHRRELDRVDELLDLVPAPETPQGLVEGVLASSRAEQERREREFQRLDALLDRMPAPERVVGLAQRVIAATAAERGWIAGAVGGPDSEQSGGEVFDRASGRTSAGSSVGRSWVLAGLLSAAAAVLLSVAQGLFGGSPGDSGTEFVASNDAELVPIHRTDVGADNDAGQVTSPGSLPDDSTRVEQADTTAAADAELLADLAVLEEWELLMDEDLEVLLAELEEVDEWLLQLPEDENG